MHRKISLRTELMQEDLSKMILWTSNDRVCRYLNEHRRITAHLKQVYDSRLPVFTPLFNQNGRFYMLCADGDQAIGFLRMAHAPGNAAEIVIAIGDESMWGQGYGHAGVSEALKIAFFEMRKEKLIAHIHHENRRSRRMFASLGFSPSVEGDETTEYQLTWSEYVRRV